MARRHAARRRQGTRSPFIPQRPRRRVSGERRGPAWRRRDDAPVISVRDLTKTYDVGEVEVHALRGVSLDISPGSSSR